MDATREVETVLSNAKPQKLTAELVQDAKLLITMGGMAA
jgi:protein-tyrosine-phosphatase